MSSKRYSTTLQSDQLIQTKQVDANFTDVNRQHYYLYQSPNDHTPIASYDDQLGLLDFDTDHLGTPKAVYEHDTGELRWQTKRY